MAPLFIDINLAGLRRIAMNDIKSMVSESKIKTISDVWLFNRELQGIVYNSFGRISSELSKRVTFVRW